MMMGKEKQKLSAVKANGVETQHANRCFTVSNLPLVAGPKLTYATAVDAAGNQATATVTVVRQAAGKPAERVFSGNNQTGPIGSAMQHPLVARVLNAFGQPVANVRVIFRASTNTGHSCPGNPGRMP